MSNRVAVSGRLPHSGWNPTKISGLLMWLRGDLGVTLDVNSKVLTWADQSGNGNNASQFSTGTAPSVTASDVNYNNQTSINFGSNKYLTSSTSLGVANSARTFVFICSTNNTTTTIFTLRKGANGIILAASQSGGHTVLSFSDSTGGNSTIVTPISMVKPSVFTLFLPGAGSNITYEQSGRTSAMTFTGAQGTETGTAGFYLGSNYALNAFWGGPIAEVIVYDTVISAANRRLLYKYLTDRYLLPIYMPVG